MPIRPVHAVSPGLSLGTAFVAGQGDLAKQRAEFWLRQQQLAEQARQFNVGTMADLYQQRMGQIGAERRMLFGAQQDRARMERAAQLASQRDALAYQHDKDMFGLQQQGRLDLMGREEDMRVRSVADEKRYAAESLLGGVGPDGSTLFDPSKLTEEGSKLHKRLSGELSDIVRQAESGRLNPRDYNTAISSLLSRAQAITLPRYQQQAPPSMEQIVKQRTWRDPETGMFWYQGANGELKPYQPRSDGQKPGAEVSKPRIIPGVGVMIETPDGKSNLAVNFADIQKDVAAGMQAMEVKPWFDESGAYHQDIYAAIFKQRYEARLMQLGISPDGKLIYGQDQGNNPFPGSDIGIPQPPPPGISPQDAAGAGQPEPNPMEPPMLPQEQQGAQAEPFGGLEQIPPPETPQQLEEMTRSYEDMHRRYYSGQLDIPGIEHMAAIRKTLGINPQELPEPKYPRPENIDELEQYARALGQIMDRYPHSAEMPYEIALVYRSLMKAMAEKPQKESGNGKKPKKEPTKRRAPRSRKRSRPEIPPMPKVTATPTPKPVQRREPQQFMGIDLGI